MKKTSCGSVEAMKQRKIARGFSLIEALTVIAVAGVMATIAVPITRSAMRTYRLNSAVAGITGAIQSTRYQAITYGCPHRLAFSQTTTTYQLSNQILSGLPPVCAAAYTNLGGTVSWSGTPDIVVSPATTLQFNPNGIVTATVGSLAFTVTSGSNVKTITITGVGNVNVTP
jgi:prepilin-type N-terminal cleavage/methylation domain-containing protein